MHNKLKIIFTGSEIEVNLLKELLGENGIGALVRDPATSGIRAGFFGGSFSSLDLMVEETDAEKAGNLVSEFIRSREADTK